jgi:hypothetical protein
MSVRCLLTVAWLSALAATAAVGHEDMWKLSEDNAAWRAECGACHMAFPPAMLPAADWAVIMRSLDRHFGANASLDEPVRLEIAAFLERNGESGLLFGGGDEAPRITATAAFERKHQGAIRLWRKGKVKTLVDCPACHQGSGM